MFLARREMGGFLRIYLVVGTEGPTPKPDGGMFVPVPRGDSPPICNPGVWATGPSQVAAVKMLRIVEEMNGY
jgi:hypothetical protein